MPTPLSSALLAKQKVDKLTLTALAEAIGVSAPSATTALKGKSFPNATTAPRFAKFLGITVEELQAFKKGKPATKTKSAVKIAPVAMTETAAKAKPSSKATKGKPAKAKPTMPAKVNTSITIAEAAELAADVLAVAVHGATDDQRRVITAVLGG